MQVGAGRPWSLQAVGSNPTPACNLTLQTGNRFQLCKGGLDGRPLYEKYMAIFHRPLKL